MIRIQDAFRFAKLKMFQHKVRNILSIIAVALGLIIMLVMLLGSTGVLNFGSRMFKDSLADRFFTREELNGEDINVALEEYKAKTQTFGPTNFWVDRSSTGQYSLEAISSGDYVTVRAFDPEFVGDFLFEGETFADDGDGVIPVIVPREWLAMVENEQYYLLENKERYELTARVAEAAKGRQTKLFEEEGEDTGITLEIVGLSSTGFGGSVGIGYNDIVIPMWALEDEDVEALFEDGSTSVITEFATRDDRDAFVKAGLDQYQEMLTSSPEKMTAIDGPVNSIPQPVIGRFEMFQEVVKIARRVVFGIGGFILFIAMCFILVNISKAVADSRKEIGVFRAVGARAFDIQKVFYSYAFIIVNIGFLSAFVIACVVNAAASAKWGEKMFYELASMSTEALPAIPKLLFLGFDIPALGMLYLIVLGCTLLAAAIPAFRASRIDPVVALKD